MQRFSWVTGALSAIGALSSGAQAAPGGRPYPHTIVNRPLVLDHALIEGETALGVVEGGGDAVLYATLRGAVGVLDRLELGVRGAVRLTEAPANVLDDGGVALIQPTVSVKALVIDAVAVTASVVLPDSRFDRQIGGEGAIEARHIFLPDTLDLRAALALAYIDYGDPFEIATTTVSASALARYAPLAEWYVGLEGRASKAWSQSTIEVDGRRRRVDSASDLAFPLWLEAGFTAASQIDVVLRGGYHGLASNASGTDLTLTLRGRF